ncbi:hypothetical protein KR222_002388 [Zaprionus bogoriensis]|nr:hypothetical protein KR222_002388 [Zaprionus bogoriensis]
MENQGMLSYVKKVIHSLVVSTPDRMTIAQLKRDYANEEGCALPFIKLGFRDIESFLRSIPDTITVHGYGPMAEVIAQRHAKTAHIQNLVQCQKRPCKRQRNRRRAFPFERSDLVFPNECGRLSSNNNNNRSNNYNKNSQAAPAGNEAASMIESFTKLKQPPRSHLESAKNGQPGLEILSSDEGSESDAIPAYAVDQRVLGVDYPPETVQFDQQLPLGDIHKKVKLFDCIEVQLVTVSSPHSFYFWIHDEQHDDYRAMSSNMQRFYNNIDEKRYSMPLSLIMPGHLGVIHAHGAIWQRVKVLNIKAGNPKNIEVQLVDTGERSWVGHSQLKYLCKDFATLPAQCWPGRLACVTPRQGTQFSANASIYFYELVCYRRLYAKIEQISEADNVAYMVLVDSDAQAAIKNVNVALIESGWVRRCYMP